MTTIKRGTWQQVTRMQPINGYHAPQWLVEPVGNEIHNRGQIAAMLPDGFESLDTEVMGWGPYNQIIRTYVTDDDVWTPIGSYLALVVTMYDAMVAYVDAVPALVEHRDIILHDWEVGDEHAIWILTAPVAEVVDWAETAEQAARS